MDLMGGRVHAGCEMCVVTETEGKMPSGLPAGCRRYERRRVVKKHVTSEASAGGRI